MLPKSAGGFLLMVICFLSQACLAAPPTRTPGSMISGQPRECAPEIVQEQGAKRKRDKDEDGEVAEQDDRYLGTMMFPHHVDFEAVMDYLKLDSERREFGKYHECIGPLKPKAPKKEIQKCCKELSMSRIGVRGTFHPNETSIYGTDKGRYHLRLSSIPNRCIPLHNWTQHSANVWTACGLECVENTDATGDAFFKWRRDLQEDMQKRDGCVKIGSIKEVTEQETAEAKEEASQVDAGEGKQSVIYHAGISWE